MISLEYAVLEEKIIVLVAKDESTGATLAYDFLAKCPADDWVVRQLVRDLEDWGRRGVRLQRIGDAGPAASDR